MMNNLAVTLLAAVLALSAIKRTGAWELNRTQLERTACMHGVGECLKLKGAQEQRCLKKLTQQCARSAICPPEPPNLGCICRNGEDQDLTASGKIPTGRWSSALTENASHRGQSSALGAENHGFGDDRLPSRRGAVGAAVADRMRRLGHRTCPGQAGSAHHDLIGSAHRWPRNSALPGGAYDAKLRRRNTILAILAGRTRRPLRTGRTRRTGRPSDRSSRQA
jgi:hypothetical protein